MVEKSPGPGFWPSVYEPLRTFGSRIAEWISPSADAKATGKEYEITIELPGVDKDDIDISLHEGVLTVKGEKRSERTEEGEGYFFSERQYGRFQRTFRLPGDVKDDKVSADFSNGVLKIRVPKRGVEEKKTKKIEVNVR